MTSDPDFMCEYKDSTDKDTPDEIGKDIAEFWLSLARAIYEAGGSQRLPVSMPSMTLLEVAERLATNKIRFTYER